MFQTILPHYCHVKGIVRRYESLCYEQFPQICNWDSFGKFILIQLMAQDPETLSNPLQLQLCFRVRFAQALSILVDNKVEFA